MDSFYGGKQGISFVIKDKFKTIDEMETSFSNSSYTTVWYGEYCIIDTDNKNNPDNGKVFRRTGTHTIQENDTAHAEYVGQVVGPAGGIPKIELEDLNTLKSNFNNLKSDKGEIYYWNNKSTPCYTSTWEKDGLGTKTAESGVIYKSGKAYYENSTTPALKYGFYTFQQNDKDEAGNFPLATIGIGFEIPYMDFTFSVIPTGYSNTPSVTETSLNDFYKSYTLSIPRGVPGGRISDLKYEKVDPWEGPSGERTRKYYTLDDLQDDYTFGSTISPTHIPTSKTIMVGQYKYYDHTGSTSTYVMDPTSTTTNTPAKFYLWDIKEIDSINLGNTPTDVNNYGKFSVQYTDTTTPFVSNLPIIRTLSTSFDGSKYVLQGQYGTSTNSVTIGTVGPNTIGVWAYELVNCGTVTTPDIHIHTTRYDEQEGEYIDVYEVDPSKADPGNNNPSNLGVLTDENNTEAVFYRWNAILPTPTASNTPTGTWNKMGQTTGNASNIEIIDDDYFNSKDISHSILFQGTSVPLSVSPETFGIMPWK